MLRAPSEPLYRLTSNHPITYGSMLSEMIHYFERAIVCPWSNSSAPLNSANITTKLDAFYFHSDPLAVGVKDAHKNFPRNGNISLRCF